MIFRDKSDKYHINLNDDVYEFMLHECYCFNPYETGGILIGNYSDDNKTANILKSTSQPCKSKQTQTTFVRSVDGLMSLLDELWNKGEYYLGEWHYHPNSSTEPSSIDKKQMIDLSMNDMLNCPEPILIIIGGGNKKWDISVRVYAMD